MLERHRRAENCSHELTPEFFLRLVTPASEVTYTRRKVRRNLQQSFVNNRDWNSDCHEMRTGNTGRIRLRIPSIKADDAPWRTKSRMDRISSAQNTRLWAKVF